jgi:hypothetical protein
VLHDMAVFVGANGGHADIGIDGARHQLAKEMLTKSTVSSVCLVGNNSLIPPKNFLIIEIFSLLICVGNCARSDCGAAVFCYEIGLGSPEIAKFPVKFPVSREFAWRRVRSALRRQPMTPASLFLRQ